MRLPILLAAISIPLAGLAFGMQQRRPVEPVDVAARLKLLPAFADEFDGAALKPHWRTDFAAPSDGKATIAKRTLWNNRERQVYVAPSYLGMSIQPFALKDGILTITARTLSPQQRAAAMAELNTLPERQRTSAMRNIAYSSGVITTRGSMAQRYGYFEMRARWSGGKGLWPAFWMLPQHGSWPPELDIMEAHGDKPSVVFQSKHSQQEDSVTKRVAVPSDTGQWHRYGLLWTPKLLVFFVDGRETSRQSTPADANVPMYLLANLAVGGKWPGDPDGTTRFPATMQIDWIRAYKLPRDWNDGRLDALK
jgi:beta-glucanase (GH16 family)